MKKWESSTLDVYFDVEGEEKTQKVSFKNLIESPTEEDIITFGQTMAKLSPEQQTLNSSVIISKSRVIG